MSLVLRVPGLLLLEEEVQVLLAIPLLLLLMVNMVLQCVPLRKLILHIAGVMGQRGPQAVIYPTQRKNPQEENSRRLHLWLTTPRHPTYRQKRHPTLNTHNKKKNKRKRKKKKKKKFMKRSNKMMRYKSNNISSISTPRKMARNRRKIKLPLLQMSPQRQATVTAAPRSRTPPPLFCFCLLRVRLLLLWWPRESEGERAVHRPHTHSFFTLSVSVCPLAWALALTSPYEAHT
ncbi:hypothetical protein MOQ_005372 [Trypanosoma cruzi marinkellei]|uniref:Uncharacterized protein n=1 Tax=Trypanosoma cruzi marinkellei TaxID=85056 RepID=K2N7T3_TRYCR|nr:hypothetical protein MOQ_005372 [Trypanosoma cruzi marinkellei]